MSSLERKQGKATKGANAEHWVNVRMGGSKPRLEGAAMCADNAPSGEPHA